ncbi:hypothetical protein SH661x_000576 [Planctomicrobium sp. SH661]|uniref:hypothetical protein n=1 Tax=Planctomicrobium sp. SH661 TaxID=3448124 RepID=UPI003F5BFA26
MPEQFTPLYGVYMLDQNEWRQVSEHWRLAPAKERAREAREVMGVRVRIRSRDGMVLEDFEERRSGQPTQPARSSDSALS